MTVYVPPKDLHDPYQKQKREPHACLSGAQRIPICFENRGTDTSISRDAQALRRLWHRSNQTFSQRVLPLYEQGRSCLRGQSVRTVQGLYAWFSMLCSIRLLAHVNNHRVLPIGINLLGSTAVFCEFWSTPSEQPLRCIGTPTKEHMQGKFKGTCKQQQTSTQLQQACGFVLGDRGTDVCQHVKRSCHQGHQVNCVLSRLLHILVTAIVGTTLLLESQWRAAAVSTLG